MIKPRFKDVFWSLPCLFREDLLAFSFLNLLNQNDINFKFDIYGAPLSAWSNSVFNVLQTSDIPFVERILDNFKYRGLNPVLSFNKFDISNSDLKDEFCNSVLKECNKVGCSVEVASVKLFKHIRKNFPDIYCIASPINTIYRFQNDIKKDSYKFEKELKYYNDLLKLYNRVIVRPDFVKTEFFKEISDLSRVEVIVNYTCKKNCKYSINNIENACKDYVCSNEYTHTNPLEPELFLSFEDISNLINLGVKHFRILPNVYEQNSMLLMNLINFIFEENSLNSQLFRCTIENMEAVKFFFFQEIIKDAKIQNLSLKNNPYRN